MYPILFNLYLIFTFLYTKVLLLQPQSVEAGEESAGKPFEGFYLLGIGVMILVVIAVLFVSYKVMRRMNKTEKEE